MLLKTCASEIPIAMNAPKPRTMDEDKRMTGKYRWKYASITAERRCIEKRIRACLIVDHPAGGNR